MTALLQFARHSTASPCHSVHMPTPLSRVWRRNTSRCCLARSRQNEILRTATPLHKQLTSLPMKGTSVQTWQTAHAYVPSILIQERHAVLTRTHLLEVLSIIPIVHVKEVWTHPPLPTSAAGSGATVTPAAGSASSMGAQAALLSPAPDQHTVPQQFVYTSNLQRATSPMLSRFH